MLSMATKEVVQLTDIIGKSGKYQRIVFLVSFYFSWFLGTSTVTPDLLMPIVTICWDWDKLNSNRTTFISTDCIMEDIMQLNRSSNLSNSDSKLIFESQYSRNTLTEELGLVCESSWLVSFASCFAMIGLAIGGLFVPFSERFGRRPFIISAAILAVVFNLCMAFPVGYTMFTAAFCLFRATVNQTHMLLFMQAVEVTATSRRQYIGVFVKSGLLVGQTILVCASWLLKDWFYTQLFQTALAVTILPVVWYLQESPVYLAVRGKYEEARKVILTIVKRNGLDEKELEPKISIWLAQMEIQCSIETKAEKGKLKDLFQNSRISLYTFGLIFTYFTTAFIYTGLVLNAESFGSGLYVDLTASNAFSLVAVLVVAALLIRTSIRCILCVAFLLEGLTSVVYTVSYSSPLARTVVSVFSRVFISAAYANTRIYVNEVYPTSVRGVGAGFTAFVGSLMSAPSSFMKELGGETYAFVPFVLFAVLSLLSALVYYVMPETRKRPIVHTIHDLKSWKDEKKNKKTNVFVIPTQDTTVKENLNVQLANLTSFKELNLVNK